MFVGYRNDGFFPHTNPYISNVTQYFELGLPATCDERFFNSGYLGETSSMDEED